MSTIVIGAGLAGLTAANALADRGATVTVIEARTALGGRASTDRKDGHLFNQGPHALYLQGDGLRILQGFGLDPAGGVPSTKGSLALRDGELGALPGDTVSLLRTPLLKGRQRVEIGRVMSRIPELDPREFSRMSTSDWLATALRSDAARDLVAGLIRVATYSADLDVLSAEIGVAQLQLAFTGVRYVDGGWQSIIDDLADRFRALGGALMAGMPVTGIVRDGRGWKVVTTADEFGADRVIVAVTSPQLAARLTGSTYLQTFAASVEPITAAVMDVGLRRLPRPERRFAYGIDAPLYYSVHNPPADLGDGVTLHVMKYLLNADQTPAAALRDELEDWLTTVQPGWRDELGSSRFLRRMVVSNALPTAAGGGSSGRPGVVVADREGLFVAGDWVGTTGHLADASIASGLAAAEASMDARLVAA